MMRRVRHLRSRVTGLVVLTAVCGGSQARGSDITSPYGVTAFIPSPVRFDAMKDANIAWGRYDFSWRSVEAAGKGQYNWDVTDYAVAEANARGLHIYAGLGYTPTWASAGGHSYDSPTNNQDYYDYVYAAVSRYKGSIKYWEMWNEPNLTQFWNAPGTSAADKAAYIELFKVGADAAHAADPDCMVLGPEISSAGGAAARTWMTDVLQAAGNKIDIISFHQYDGGDIPSGRLAGMDLMRTTINNAGYGNKPIWLTESGFRSDGGTMTEQKQADYLTETLTGITARPWIKNFFWYQLWEGGAGTEKWGLLREDESRKPAWQAYHDYTVAHPARETASINLSTTDIEGGIKRVVVPDGNTTQVIKGSRSSRKNTNAAGGDIYMYFDVDDAFAFQGNRPVIDIDVDYHDLGTATLTLEYDSTGNGEYKSAGSVVLSNKDTWKQITFHLTDAYFGNRQNGGADFRISAGVGVTFYLDQIFVNAPQTAPEPAGIGSWRINAGGTWQTTTNWHTGAAPNGIGATATLGDVITDNRLVSTTAPVTLGTLNFKDASQYVLTGLGSLTMQVAAGTAQINVTQGSHKINVPLIIASNTQMNIASGTSLIIADPVTVNANRTLSKIGTGTVTYQSIVTLGTGASLLLEGSALVAGLAIGTDSKVDLSGNLTINGSDYDDITSKVKQGLNGGDWKGKGITSSSAANDPNGATALGTADGDEGVMVKYTYYGDTNLDGSVGLEDFEQFVIGKDIGHADWTAGDFDYNGAIGASDFHLFLRGLVNQGRNVYTPELYAALSSFAASEGLSVDLSAVPEPSSLGVAVIAAGGLLRRRRSDQNVYARTRASAAV